MKVFEYVKSGHEIDNIRAFLYRTANNLIIDYVRKKHEESLDALQEAGFDPTGSSGDELAEALDEKHILAVLQKLGKESRELIVMRHIDNLKPQEIAEILGIEANTASVRIHRAMQELKVLLTQKP